MSPVRGTTCATDVNPLTWKISIHVPREGDDGAKIGTKETQYLISIHVPREGDDSPQRHQTGTGAIFQSTSPVRGTTTFG